MPRKKSTGDETSTSKTVDPVKVAREEGRKAGKRVAAEGRAVARSCPYDGGPEATVEDRQKRAAWLEGLNEFFV